MIDAERFIAAAEARGFALYTGVPCSYLTPFINGAINSPRLRYVGAANEGDAVAIAAGADLGGRPAIAMFQNSGLGNAVNPLTSLTYTFRIPVLLIVTWRGEPGGRPDEPQHELMGRITAELLQSMGIEHRLFPQAEAEIEPALQQAVATMRRESRPFAFVMRHGSVRDTTLAPATERYPARRAPRVDVLPATATRQQMLRAVQAALGPRDVVIATTGFTGRELAALDDRACQLYMVGSMGCASSLGLGLAIVRPDIRVIVLDGDGAVLMRLGALTTIGHEQPTNLVHVLLDNGIHESTGGQRTVSPGVDFCAIAAACGYPVTESIATPQGLQMAIGQRTPGLRFVHVPTVGGVPAGLPRPETQPHEVAARLRGHLRELQSAGSVSA